MIHYRQQPDLVSAGKLAGHEVHAPALIGHLGQRHRAPVQRAAKATPGPFPAHRQGFFGVEPVDQLLVCLPAFSSQQHVEPAVAMEGTCGDPLSSLLATLHRPDAREAEGPSGPESDEERCTPTPVVLPPLVKAIGHDQAAMARKESRNIGEVDKVAAAP